MNPVEKLRRTKTKTKRAMARILQVDRKTSAKENFCVKFEVVCPLKSFQYGYLTKKLLLLWPSLGVECHVKCDPSRFIQSGMV